MKGLQARTHSSWTNAAIVPRTAILISRLDFHSYDGSNASKDQLTVETLVFVGWQDIFVLVTL